jgi:FkbM family methyltransferase
MAFWKMGLIKKWGNKSAYNRAWMLLFGEVALELKVAFTQFYSWKSPVSSLFLCLFRMAQSIFRILLGNTIHYTYGHTGEDRLLKELLNPPIFKRGFYIELGANHPTFISNTFAFYRRGWRGICVDANAAHIRSFALLRPRDIAVHAVLDTQKGERIFYRFQNDVLSTLDASAARVLASQGLSYTEEKVQTQRLDDLLESVNAPQEFDLLAIDIEEMDLPVLKTLDLKRYQPQWIMMELEDLNLLAATTHEAVQYLSQFHYTLVGFILKNAYFKKST